MAYSTGTKREAIVLLNALHRHMSGKERSSIPIPQGKWRWYVLFRLKLQKYKGWYVSSSEVLTPLGK